VVVRMVGGIVYHNICICGFSVNIQFSVIVVSADGQVEVLHCIIYCILNSKWSSVWLMKVENFVSICSALIIND
jgi:hypothetical protein